MRTRAIVCDSEYVADRLARSGFEHARIHVIPSAIPIPEISMPVPPWSPDQRTVVFCGRLVESKGLGVLLEAMREVPVPWGLRVIGDGDDAARFERRCRQLDLGGRVKFLGSLPRDAVHAIFVRAAVVVVPSLWPEPLGMVGPEALAHGCAVVGSGVGGMGEWLIDGITGLVARPGDPHDLACRITRVLEDPALASRLGRAGRQLVQSRFGLSTHADRLLDVLSSAAAGSARLDADVA